MREFNIFGPVYPDLHYHVDRKAVKAAMREKVVRGRYFTLNAGRQMGKTTLFRELVAELEGDAAYLSLLLDLEGLARVGSVNRPTSASSRRLAALGAAEAQAVRRARVSPSLWRLIRFRDLRR